jgi:hypothetical protein
MQYLISKYLKHVLENFLYKDTVDYKEDKGIIIY